MSRVFTSLPEALIEIARLEKLVTALYRQLTETGSATPSASATSSAPRKRAHPDSSPLIIYTDGSSLGNGNAGARAGCAVLTNRGFEWKARTPGAQTNNRGELYAAIVGLAQARADQNATLYTDSKYVLNGLNQWLRGWVRKGWKRADGAPVLNEDLWRMAWALVSERDERKQARVVVLWVVSHAGDPGNDRADKLAKAAAEMTPVANAPFYPPFPGIEEVQKRVGV